MPKHTSSRGASSREQGKDNPAAVKKQRSPIFWVFSLIILVLIVLSFVVAPALVGVGSSQDGIVFGSYDGEPIVYEYNSYLYHQHQNIASQWRSEVSGENIQWELFQIWRSAFNNTVIYMDLKQRAEAAGFSVSDDNVQKVLLTSGPYINNQGEFDRSLYQETPISRRQEILDQVRRDILQQQVASDLFSSKVSRGEAEFVMGLGQVEKKFDYIAFHIQDYPDDQAAAFARNNSEPFRQIDISLISLRDNQSEAETVRNRISSGEITFEEASRTYSIDMLAQDDGQEGWQYYYELLEDFEEEQQLSDVFALSSGEISELVRTDYGYAIYRVNNAARDADLEQEEVLSAIRTYMGRTARGVLQDYFTQEAQDFISLAEASGFSQAAEDAGLTVHTTDYMPLNYNGSMLLGRMSQADPQGVIGGASGNPYVLRELFSRDVGEMTGPLTTGNYVMVAAVADIERQSDEQIASLTSIYPYYTQEMQQNDFSQMVLNSPKLENNFMSVFITQLLQ